MWPLEGIPVIGGIDIKIPTRSGALSVEVAVRAIRQRWPRAEFENGITGDRYHDFGQIPFGMIEEVFVYQDCAFADRWDGDGAVPELSNTMIHIIADKDLITVVVDDRDGRIEEILGAISSALGDDILYIPAELIAA
jgi:hypothetical protein